MKKFPEIIDDTLTLVQEQEPVAPAPVEPAPVAPAPVDGAPPPVEPDPEEVPAEEAPAEEAPVDDVSALKVHMTELIRKALLINREEITPEDYASLMTPVSNANMDQMNDLVSAVIAGSSKDTGVKASKLAASF